MNRPNFGSSSFFKPPTQLLGPVAFKNGSDSHHKSLSLDDLDVESGEALAMDKNDDSRTPHTGYLIAEPRDERTDDLDAKDRYRDQFQPLVAKHIRSDSSMTQALNQGGIGRFFFGTGVGWRVYIGLLIFWVGGSQFGLLLMNRFIFWTGTYKFPYPVAMTLLQLVITHVLLLVSASLTRGLTTPLAKIGLGAIVAPSQAYLRGNRATRFYGGPRNKSIWRNAVRRLTNGSGGIAGGGLLEWQRQSVRHAFPVSVILVLKVVLSNLSYAHSSLPVYMLARIGIVPIALLLTAILMKQSHSVQTLSSTLIATSSLCIAAIHSGERVAVESIVAGVFSSFFAALFPIALLRAYRQLVADLIPQGDLLSHMTDDSSTGSKEETRAYWRTLHYTSLLSIIMLLPIVLVSGELPLIHRNCYFLDVPWFWFLMLCGGVGSWAVFTTTLLLVKATSPLTAAFVSVPRSAFQLVVLNRSVMGVHNWVGWGLCWGSCLWYLIIRGREGRRGEGFVRVSHS